MDKIEKQLRAIPKKYQERVFAAIERIMLRDFSTLDRKQLKGYENIFRIRVGNYRIIYYDDGQRIILKVVKRRDDNTYNAL